MASSSRARWTSNMAFIFAAVGSAVGLGNVWRFPYLAFKFGGGAFLLPYLIALFVFGVPLLILELSLGQMFQQGAIGAFRKTHPRLASIGFLGIFAATVIVIYYAIVMAWALFYLFQSFASDLPWSEAPKAYFFGEVLDLSNSISTMGNVNWWLMGCLFAVWSMIYWCIRNGVKSVSKVVMITVPLPILLLVVLLIRGLTLDGASEGLYYYLKPDFAALLDPEVWIAAASQIFFSLSVAMGIMIAYGSFNKKSTNILRDGIVIALCNSAVSILSGFVVFSIIGHMAVSTGQSIPDVVASGPGLAFVVFPEALSLMPWAGFFAVLFFLCLLTLGIDSAFSLVEALGAVITDAYPHLKQRHVAMSICIACAFLGLVFATDAGLYYLDVVDHFISNILLIAVGLFEVLAIGWVLGADEIRSFINKRSARKIGTIWVPIVRYVLPAILTSLLAIQVRKELTANYENYPDWAINMGWFVVIAPLTVALVHAVRTGKVRRFQPKA